MPCLCCTGFAQILVACSRDVSVTCWAVVTQTLPAGMLLVCCSFYPQHLNSLLSSLRAGTSSMQVTKVRNWHKKRVWTEIEGAVCLRRGETQAVARVVLSLPSLLAPTSPGLKSHCGAWGTMATSGSPLAPVGTISQILGQHSQLTQFPHRPHIYRRHQPQAGPTAQWPMLSPGQPTQTPSATSTGHHI